MTVSGDALLNGVIRGRHETEPAVVARRRLIDGINEHADAAGSSEGSGGLVEREDGMRGKEFDCFHFTIRASIGDIFAIPAQ